MSWLVAVLAKDLHTTVSASLSDGSIRLFLPPATLILRLAPFSLILPRGPGFRAWMCTVDGLVPSSARNYSLAIRTRFKRVHLGFREKLATMPLVGATRRSQWQHISLVCCFFRPPGPVLLVCHPVVCPVAGEQGMISASLNIGTMDSYTSAARLFLQFYAQFSSFSALAFLLRSSSVGCFQAGGNSVYHLELYSVFPQFPAPSFPPLPSILPTPPATPFPLFPVPVSLGPASFLQAQLRHSALLHSIMVAWASVE